MNDKRTKIALVTGANRGIGYAIAQGLLKADFQVIIGSRSLEKGKAAVEKLNSPSVSAVEIDIAEDESINKAFNELNGKIDRLDVLINNAGIYPDNGFNILTIDRKVLDSAIDTNTFGVIQMVQAFLPLLKKSSDARIINMSSGMGALDGLNTTASSYCLSKLALNGATIMLSQSLRSKGIAVNSMCPGWVQTDMGGASAPRTPEQGADTAIWLATEAPRNETGKFWRDRKEISF